MSAWSYSCCSACDCQHRHVMPDGPTDAKVMLIGEGPGRNEDRTGIPFVGVSGQELDETYLKLAGLDRSKVFVTNMVQCRSERNGIDVKPGDALRDVCAANHLPEEILTVYPEIVILCGATACSLVPGIDLELEHGFPRRAEIMGWEGWVVPMYHPAAGLHETRYMTPMLEDWERLGRWMRGRWQPPTTLVGIKPMYKLISTESDFWEYVKQEPEPKFLAIDTESDEGRPYSIQASCHAGHGFMILRENKQLVEAFSAWVAWSFNGVVMHFAMHDLDELEGVLPYHVQIRDTMQELYHLGNLPQGLKQAVYRIFGFKMTSYDEVVTPYSKAKLETWLAEASACAADMRLEIPHPVGPDCPTCGKRHRKDVTDWKPHEAEAVLRRVMGKLGDEYDPWQAPKWDKGVEKPRLIGRDWLPEIERQVGRLPRKSIVHAPLDRQIMYACSDADWTLRLAGWLEQERKRIVEAEWQVAA